MTPAALLNEARAAGVTLWLEGDALRYRGPREALAKLLPALKGHKPDILAALADPGAVTPIAELPKPRAPVNLDEAIRDACERVGGITTAQFRSLLSPEDLADIAAGAIHSKTLRAYAQSFAEGILVGARGGSSGVGAITMTVATIARETEDLKEAFEERAAILEHDAGLPRPEAELEAARIVATYARNRAYLWASLRAALSGYPALSVQVPARAGTVDSLPFGTTTVHVREGVKPGPVSGSVVITEAEIEAARKGRTVVRQGTFTGTPEVKG